MGQHTPDTAQSKILEVLSDGQKRDALAILEEGGRDINPRGIKTQLTEMVRHGLIESERCPNDVQDLYSVPSGC